MATGTAISDFLEDALFDHIIATYTTTKVHLFTAAPSDAGGGTEVTGGSYAAQDITLVNNGDGTAENDAEIDFGTATADWGTVTHVAIKDGANFLFWGALDTSKLIELGDGAKFAAGELVCALD